MISLQNRFSIVSSFLLLLSCSSLGWSVCWTTDGTCGTESFLTASHILCAPTPTGELPFTWNFNVTHTAQVCFKKKGVKVGLAPTTDNTGYTTTGNPIVLCGNHYTVQIATWAKDPEAKEQIIPGGTIGFRIKLITIEIQSASTNCALYLPVPVADTLKPDGDCGGHPALIPEDCHI